MKKIFSILFLFCVLFIVASCSNDADFASKTGYLKLQVNTLVSTHTRATEAPEGYTANILHVEIVNTTTNEIVKQTNDFFNDEEFEEAIKLAEGTYIVRAHSANWDGSQSGFEVPYYAAETDPFPIKAGVLSPISLVCKLANVKVTVVWDQSFKDNFDIANVKISSNLSGVSEQNFTMTESRSGYFPVSDLTLNMSATNKRGQQHDMEPRTITDAKARDHFIFTYKMAPEGEGNISEGTTHIYVDSAMQTYTYVIEVPRKSGTTLQASANAWSTFAYLSGTVTGKSSDFDASAVTLQWQKQGASTWTTVANSLLDKKVEDRYSYTLKGLEPSTSYTFRLVYEKDGSNVSSNEINFTTEGQPDLENKGFEDWHQDGKVIYPNAEGASYWDTSNPGSAGKTNNANNNVTTSTTEVKHSGNCSAQLKSKKVVIAFAAASLYTGSFGATIGTSGAWLTWGVPFNGRPTSLKGWYRYDPVAIDNTKNTQPSTAPAKGEPDQCSIYWALTTSTIRVDNTDIAGTFPNWETDPRVIAYGELPLSKCVSTNGKLVQFEIPARYHNLAAKPTHIIVCAASSRYGDYFHGGAGSTLYLDDLELVYGDEPTVK